jgi:tRNA 2-thiouridine synthesizing protein A
VVTEAIMNKNNQCSLAEAGTVEPAATLELLGTRDQLGATCATLTPAIKARLMELQPGQILLVRVDDPSALLDVPAWCILTGHALYATTEDEDGVIHFFIRKESKR